MSKIATEKDMLEIGKLDISTITAPYRCPTLSELYNYKCKLTLAPSVTYASNQCIRITDLAKCEIDAVDLGLSVKWGNMNLGATAALQVGNYYAWGEVLPKETYDLDNYKWFDSSGGRSIWTKYCLNDNEGIPDFKTVLDPDDDAAQVNLSSMWRMPTKEEWEELKQQCTWQLYPPSLRKPVGYQITGPNGNKILLPFTGFYIDSTLDSETYGYYWSCTLDKTNFDQNIRNANCIEFYSGGKSIKYQGRQCGLPIRPVISNTAPAFVIQFVNYNNKILQTFKINQGQTPKYSGPTPTKPDSYFYSYTFSGWSPTIVAATANVTYTAQFTAVQKTNIQMVDLGLSVKWANMNVGATVAPEQFGDYYAWGETETKSDYNWSTYFDNPSGDGNTFLKYNNNGGVAELCPEDDVAHVIWGDNWRMPTDAEWTELRTNCNWTWTQVNGVNGYRVSASNGNSIFLPAAAGYGGPSGNKPGVVGYYWSSTLILRFTAYASYVYFLQDHIYIDNTYGERRKSGLSVRPVCPIN